MLSFLNRTFPKRLSRPGKAKTYSRARLTLEALEDRTVPSATLLTDLPDYAPGTTATFTGSGFNVGETIYLGITSTTSDAEYYTFSDGVADGGAGDLDGVADGNFTFAWDVGTDNVDATLVATATGGTSGESASVTFTDSGSGTPVNITVENGWTPGGSNGADPTVVTCGTDHIITKVAIKAGANAEFEIENLTGVEGDENENNKHSPVIIADGYLGYGNNFSTTAPDSGPYYSVTGLGTATVTVTAVNGAQDISHVDYFCEDTVVTTSTATIEVHKFEDHDGDGIRDGGDQDIPWNITIVVGSNVYAVTTETESDFDLNDDGDVLDVGDAIFDGNTLSVIVDPAALEAGINWSATEADVVGWTHTTLTSDSGTLTTVNSSAVADDFGNFQNIDICGTKWEDHDGDGVQDEGTDELVGGFTFILNDDGNGIVDDGETFVTSDDGTWCFTNLGPGTYAVTEAVREGWTQTTPNPDQIIVGGLGQQSGEDVEDLSFGNFENIDICGTKYQDHDGDGVQDAGTDALLGGFTFILNDDGDGIVDNGETSVTSTDGTWCFTNIGPGAWTVTEATPALSWVQTQGKDGYSGTASSGEDVTDLFFGNTNVSAENGKTIGFWSNKNGQALLTQADFAALTALNLKNANGSDRNFTGTLAQNKTALKNWLLSASATNMASMLSAQLAATQLNLLHGNYGSSATIYVGGALTSWSGNSQGANLATNLDGLVNEYGFASIQGLIDAANASLGSDPVTTSSGATRSYQEALKIVFDAMNNNLAIFA